MDNREGTYMDDQTEQPLPDMCEETDESGQPCLGESGHTGPHRNADRIWGEITAPQPQDGRCSSSVEDGGRQIRCQQETGHSGDHIATPAGGAYRWQDVSWPPAEWKVPPSVEDHGVRSLTEAVERLSRRVEELEKDREERLGYAGPGRRSAVNTSLRSHVDEQFSVSRRHLASTLSTHTSRTVDAVQNLGLRLNRMTLEKHAETWGTLERMDDRLTALEAVLDRPGGHPGLGEDTSVPGPVSADQVTLLAGIIADRLGDLLSGREKTDPMKAMAEDPVRRLGEEESTPCPATTQSATGMITCTGEEGHVGSHTNALAVWSDRPPYEIY